MYVFEKGLNEEMQGFCVQEEICSRKMHKRALMIRSLKAAAKSSSEDDDEDDEDL